MFCCSLHVLLSVHQTFFIIGGSWIVTKRHLQFNGHPSFYWRQYEHWLSETKRSISLQNYGMAQLTTGTRSTKDSATLIDQVFHYHFFGNPDCGIPDAGLTDHCAFFVKLPLCCKKYVETGTIYKVFFIHRIKMQDKPIWNYFQKKWKCTISMKALMNKFKCF